MPKLSNFYQDFFKDSDRVMALMILSLHALLIWGNLGNLHSALFLCHYGLFLIWQPIVGQSNKLSWQAIIAIVIGAVLTMTFSNWWAIAFWLAGLFALIGGRVFSSDSQHSTLPNILSATYLLAILLLWVVPKLLSATDDLAAAEFLLVYFLPILPLTILFLTAKNRPGIQPPNIDFFYTLLLFLLTLIIILGSFAIGVIWKIHYIKLLIVAVMGLATTLIALSWLWNPSSSFSGLELLMSRYLLSLGLPFEQWIRKIAAHADFEPTANKFLKAAMQELSQLSWVSGLDWKVDDTHYKLGQKTNFISTFKFQQLNVTLYSSWQLTPAMYLHVQLLTQILGEFYEAKLREETISQNIYMQTFYETGSRLTHDIKNILQSLGTLCTAAEQNEDNKEDDARLVELIRKQLPRLNQRLAATLTKLERPSTEKKRQAKVSTWWRNFIKLNTHLNSNYKVQFDTPNVIPKVDIDPEVLESVVDNLLQNALEKAKLDPNILITISLLPAEPFCLEVSDTGAAMPKEIAEQLFKAHVSSKNGLGVGLYHAAHQAEQAGYTLSLEDNRDGAVKFKLERMIDVVA
ncbi:MAG TPA: ATP-binding protein [Methylotenera sp.]|nr:ATP-binding protein [Methylotenera sp.]